MNDAPEWAFRAFCKRADLDHNAVMTSADLGVLRSAVRAGAALIAEHEEEPTDPLLVEARALWSESYTKDEDYQRFCRDGHYDNIEGVQATYKAIKRGFELGKASC